MVETNSYIASCFFKCWELTYISSETWFLVSMKPETSEDGANKSQRRKNASSYRTLLYSSKHCGLWLSYVTIVKDVHN